MLDILIKELNFNKFQENKSLFQRIYKKGHLARSDYFRVLHMRNRLSFFQSMVARNIVWNYLIQQRILNFKITSTRERKPIVLSKFHVINISISHSYYLVAVSISDHPVGIDVEYVKRPFPIEPRAKWKGKNYINPYRTWTCKESYVKYLGVGLRKKLLSIEVSFLDSSQNVIHDKDSGTDYLARTFAFHKDYLITVLVDELVKDIDLNNHPHEIPYG